MTGKTMLHPGDPCAALAPAAGLVGAARVHRTSTMVRITAKPQLSRQGVPYGTATA